MDRREQERPFIKATAISEASLQALPRALWRALYWLFLRFGSRLLKRLSKSILGLRKVIPERGPDQGNPYFRNGGPDPLAAHEPASDLPLPQCQKRLDFRGGSRRQVIRATLSRSTSRSTCPFPAPSAIANSNLSAALRNRVGRDSHPFDRSVRTGQFRRRCAERTA